jgi:hypothetical protein
VVLHARYKKTFWLLRPPSFRCGALGNGVQCVQSAYIAAEDLARSPTTPAGGEIARPSRLSSATAAPRCSAVRTRRSALNPHGLQMSV